MGEGSFLQLCLGLITAETTTGRKARSDVPSREPGACHAHWPSTRPAPREYLGA